jgi:hypothetical protein
MKIKIPIFIMAMALAGCGRSDDQKQITDLQTRVTALEQKVQSQQKEISNYQMKDQLAMALANSDLDQITKLVALMGVMEGSITNMDARLEYQEHLSAVNASKQLLQTIDDLNKKEPPPQQ